MNRAHSKEQILREKYLDVFKVIILEMEGIEFMLQETISLCCVSLSIVSNALQPYGL